MSTAITLNFEFPSQEIADLAVEHLSAFYGYPAEIRQTTDQQDEEGNLIVETVPNPQSKLEWTKHAIARELRDRIEARAVKAAQATIEAQIHAAITQTVVT